MADPAKPVASAAPAASSAALPPLSAAPAPEATPKEEPKKEEKPADPAPVASNDVTAKLDYKSIYISGDLGYLWRGMGNSTQDRHGGLAVGFSLQYPALSFGNKLKLSADFGYRREGVSQSIATDAGPARESKATIDRLQFFGLVFTFTPFQPFDISLGFQRELQTNPSLHG